MKRSILKAVLFIAAFALLFIAFVPVNAQTAPKKADKVLRDTLVKGVKTQILVGSRGGKYILITPASGKTYKKYLKK